MRPRIVLTIVRKELLEALRDRRTLFMMIVLPILLYPLLILGVSRYLCVRVAVILDVRLVDHGSIPELLERSGCTNLTDAFLRNIAA